MHVHVKARCVIRKSKAVCSAKAAFKQPHDEFLETYFRTERCDSLDALGRASLANGDMAT